MSVLIRFLRRLLFLTLPEIFQFENRGTSFDVIIFKLNCMAVNGVKRLIITPLVKGKNVVYAKIIIIIIGHNLHLVQIFEE